MYGPEVSVADSIMIDDLRREHPKLDYIVNQIELDAYWAGYYAGVGEADTRETSSWQRKVDYLTTGLKRIWSILTHRNPLRSITRGSP